MMGEENYSISSLKLIRWLQNQKYGNWEEWRGLHGYVLWYLQSIVRFLLFLQSKWGQCSVTLIDISPARTGLAETHKPVTASSVNHYPATLYLVHICRFTGLWNVFSVELGPIKLRCWAASWELRVTTSSSLTSDNQLMQTQKWEAAFEFNCLTNLGISSVVQEWERGC